jgi:hypothetical protein
MHIPGFDFLDDVDNMPTANDILNRGARYFGFDPEDFATCYRANRDRFLKAENEYVLATSYGTNRLMTGRTEFYMGFGDGTLRSNNHEGARKAPNPMPTWSFNDPLKFANAVPTEFAIRSIMSVEAMTRFFWTQEFGRNSWWTKAFIPEFESRTFSHSVITSPGGTSASDRIRLNSNEYPSVVLPNGDLLFYSNGGYDTETGEQFYGLCVQSATTGLISNFEVKKSDGTVINFNSEPGLNEPNNASLFFSNGNIFLSFNYWSGGYQTDSIQLEEGNMTSRLFKIALDGTIDESFFPTIFRYERLLNIKNQLIGSKNDEISVKNSILPYLTYVNQGVATIVGIDNQITTLNSEKDLKISLKNSKIVERDAIVLILDPIYNGESTEYTQEQVTAFEVSRDTLNNEISQLIYEIETIDTQIIPLIEQRGYSIQDRDANLVNLTSLNYPAKPEGYTQAEIDAIQASIDTLNAEVTALGEEANALSNTINSGIEGIQKFNALVNVHYVQGTTGANATSGAYYLSFDKLDEYGPLDAENNEYWEPISIGLLKVDEDGSNPTAIFKEDVIFFPRTEADGLGDPFEFSTGNVKKSLMLSNGDFILYTAETQSDGSINGHFPKFIKVSKEGVVDLSFTVDGYADTLLENAAEMTPALDQTRIKVLAYKGTWDNLYSPNYLGSSQLGVNGMIELPNGKILIYGSFASIITGRPIGSGDYDIIHNIYDTGCFAVLNADGSLDTTFNNTAEMSAEYYKIAQNAPAPWGNGESLRVTKNMIAPVGFQYAAKSSGNYSGKNFGGIEITFAKIIGDKVYFSIKSDAMVSYNQSHLLDGSSLYRINLNDLTLDETFDFRYFEQIRDIVSTTNGQRIYTAKIANGHSSQSNIIYNLRWAMNNDLSGVNKQNLNPTIFNRGYLMKIDLGLGGYVMEPTYNEMSWYASGWNQVGEYILPQTPGIFIFEMDEVNRGQITYHIPYEDVISAELLRNSMWETDNSGVYSQITNLSNVFGRYCQGETLTKSELDKVELYKHILSERYTSEILWRDLSVDKIEPVDGVSEGWTPLGFSNNSGIFQGEYTLSEVLPDFLNYIPSVPTMNTLKGHTASNGDVSRVAEMYTEMIYLNGKWSDIDNSSFCDVLTTYRAARDAKLKAFNELVLSLKPFTYAAYHIPKANLDDYIQSL